MITREDVQAAHAAGYALRSPMPNPYAGTPLRPWERARMGADEVRRYEREARNRRLLARVWLTAWRKGLDAYAAERGLARRSDFPIDYSG